MMRNGMLNINGATSDGSDPDDPHAPPEREALPPSHEDVPSDHAALVDEVVSELAAVKATEQRGHFGGWVRKSVSMAHFHVLAALESEGSRSVGTLARELDVSLASATGIISRMEERGLVRRGRDADDRRVVMVELTDAGRTIRSDIDRHGVARLRALLDTLTEDDLRHFLIGVRALRAARARMAEAEAAGPEHHSEETSR